tara:strand:+ start:18834 stop:19706 length:873 start_codon:yes stop_codon:yes gene_type:complete
MRILLIIILLIFLSSCTSPFGKKEKTKINEKISQKNEIDITNQKAITVYQEALKSLEEGQLFYASKKFSEAEALLPQTEWAAKSALMSSYCLYAINFYDEAISNLERFIKMYPADKNLPYAHYLIAISYYEQILDEKKDIDPLLLSKEKIEFFIKKYPNTDYSIDLKFKLDLIINQLAAKEMSIARYYIENEKWIAAINRLKVIVKDYERTIFIDEALHRLVEIYYKIGLEEEANAAAVLLGYNYNSSEWYEKSYKVLNKDYRIKKIEKANKEEEGLVKRILKKVLFIDE